MQKKTRKNKPPVQEAPAGKYSSVKIPDTKDVLANIKKKKKKNRKRCCQCGNPRCRSPITDPKNWKWVYYD